MKKRFMTLSLALLLTLSLAIPAGASDTVDQQENTVDAVTLKMIEDIFTNQETCFVFDREGNEITESFLNKYREAYNVGDYSSIAEEISSKCLSASCPEINEAMPRLVVGFSASTRVYASYAYGTTSNRVYFVLRVTGGVNDSNRTFSYINDVTLDKSSIQGNAGVEVYWRKKANSTNISGNTATQWGILTIYESGRTWEQQWFTFARVGDPTGPADKRNNLLTAERIETG